MSIIVETEISPFGRMRLVLDESASSAPDRGVIRYCVPQKTASGIYYSEKFWAYQGGFE